MNSSFSKKERNISKKERPFSKEEKNISEEVKNISEDYFTFFWKRIIFFSQYPTFFNWPPDHFPYLYFQFYIFLISLPIESLSLSYNSWQYTKIDTIKDIKFLSNKEFKEMMSYFNKILIYVL